MTAENVTPDGAEANTHAPDDADERGAVSGEDATIVPTDEEQETGSITSEAELYDPSVCQLCADNKTHSIAEHDESIKAQLRHCLTFEQILHVEDRSSERVSTPEWGEGGYVNIRGLSAQARGKWEAESVNMETGQADQSAMADYKVRLVVRCMVNDSGERLFTDAGVVQLGRKSATVIERLYKVAARLSGLEAEAEAKAAKNSSVGPLTEPPSE